MLLPAGAMDEMELRSTVFHGTLFYLCTCVVYLMMVEWNDRYMFDERNRIKVSSSSVVCVDLNRF